jgi:hypothetical protein
MISASGPSRGTRNIDSAPSNAAVSAERSVRSPSIASTPAGKAAPAVSRVSALIGPEPYARNSFSNERPTFPVAPVTRIMSMSSRVMINWTPR